MKKILKEVWAAAMVFGLWMSVVMIAAIIDEAVGYCLTNNDITKIIVQVIIHGCATLLLIFLRLKTITAIGLDIFLMLMMWIITDDGMAHSMGIVMMACLIPVYLINKRRAECKAELWEVWKGGE